MASVSIYQYFTLTLDDREIKGGSLASAKTIELNEDEAYDQTFKIAPETAVKIWDKTENEALGSFVFGWLEADLDVLLQITTDAGTSDYYFVTELKGSGTAGTMGPAQILGSDLALKGDGTVDLFTGTEDTIDEIWVYNQSTEDTARVRIVLAT